MVSRTRTTFESKTQELVWKEYRYGGPTGATYSSILPGSYGKTIVDTVTPGYFKKCREGGFLPLNPVDIREESTVARPFDGKQQDIPDPSLYWEGEVWFAGINHLLPAEEPPPIGMLDAILSTAVEKAKAPNWDALTFFAEAQKTAELLRHPLAAIGNVATTIANLVKAKKGRRVRASRDVAESFQSLWLSGRYGWRPAFHDASNIWEEFTRTKVKPFVNLGRSSIPIGVSDSKSDVLYVGPTWGNIDLTTERTGEMRVSAFAAYELTPTLMKPMTNPLVTGWELTPFSFVMDWFVDVGTWLNAVSPSAGREYLDTCVSVQTSSRLFTKGVSRNDGSWDIIGSDFQLDHTVKHYNRFKVGLPPTPGIRPKLDLWKMLDLVALASKKQRAVWRILGS